MNRVVPALFKHRKARRRKTRVDEELQAAVVIWTIFDLIAFVAN